MYPTGIWLACLSVAMSYIIYSQFFDFPRHDNTKNITLDLKSVALLSTLPLLACVGIMLVTISLLKIHAGFVSLIRSLDVAMSYGLQVLFLNESVDYLTIIGVLLVMVPLLSLIVWNLYCKLKRG